MAANNKKKKQKLNLPVLVIGIIILLGINVFTMFHTKNEKNETAMAALNAFGNVVEKYNVAPPDKGPVEGPLNGLLKSGSNSLNGVIGQLGLLVSVVVVCTNGIVGLIAVSAIDAFSGIRSLIFDVIIGGHKGAIPAFAVALGSIVVLTVIYVFMTKVEKSHAELTQSYEQLVENNRIIKEKDEVLSYLAYYDRLTQMPNRQLFMDTLEEKAKNSIDSFILYVDLDNFREVNEGYGHSTGDELLVEYGKRISALVRESDFVAKIGGDEFGIIFLAGSTKEDVIDCVGAIREALRKPVNIRGDKFSLTASFGSAHFPVDARSAEDIFRCAESAMFTSKTNGKDRLSFYGSNA